MRKKLKDNKHQQHMETNTFAMTGIQAGKSCIFFSGQRDDDFYEAVEET